MGLSDLFVDVSELPADGYGFFQLMFLLAVYACILFYAANMIGDGSELLLLIPSIAGIVGSCILPVLGAVPDGMIVLFSGMGPDAQTQLNVGVGALAGSTIMLITLPWALSVYAGSVDIDSHGEPDYSRRGKLAQGDVTGVPNSDSIKKGGTVMLVTSTTYILLQGPAFFLNGKTLEEVAEGEKPWAFVGLILCLALFFGYIYYQYKLSIGGGDEVGEATRTEMAINNIVKGEMNIKAALYAELEQYKVQGSSYMAVASDPLRIWAQLPEPTQNRVRTIMKFFYKKFDTDHSGDLDHGELSKVFISMGENVSQDKLDAIFSNFDSNGDGLVNLDEFILGTTQYIYLTMYPGEDVEAMMRKSKPQNPGYGALLARAHSPAPTEATPLSKAPPKLPQSSPPPNGPTSDDVPTQTSASGSALSASTDDTTATTTQGGAPGEPVVDLDPPNSTTGHDGPGEATGLLPSRGSPKTLEMGHVGDIELGKGGTYTGSDDGDEEDGDEDEEMPDDLLDLPPDEQRKRLLNRSFSMLFFGTVLVVLFSDPMTDVLDEIGTRTGVNSFYVSFVLAPMASNASELIASYSYAAKKTSKSISIALQALQGAACMNNTFCLAIFMALIYFQGLAWQYSAETISILVAQLLVAFISYKDVQTSLDVWLILAIYPLCIFIVAGLEAIGFD